MNKELRRIRELAGISLNENTSLESLTESMSSFQRAIRMSELINVCRNILKSLDSSSSNDINRIRNIEKYFDELYQHIEIFMNHGSRAELLGLDSEKSFEEME